MGLMYIFPVDLDDQERTELLNDPISEKEILVLKTYGLPMIFWGYLAAALVVVMMMWLAARPVIAKLLSYNDDASLVGLGHLVQSTLILIPLVLLAFFFYEKHIQKSGNKLTLIYKIFFMPIWSKKITLDDSTALNVDHFMDSPNVAKIHNKAELRGFENKGY
ncbi:MAG: hypothetical protein EHM20_12115, partial [Alphaproteobacteria bacterium]